MEEVIVVEYSTNWVHEYEIERIKIEEALLDLPIQIEHIGSTAIKGLGAKPVIDIMVGIAELSVVKEHHMDRLLQFGYEYVPKPEFPDRLFFRRGKWRAGTHHLHMYALGSECWSNQLLFRNYLRDHPLEAEQYYKLKKQLEQCHKYDRVAYTSGKDRYIKHILLKAATTRTAL
ncbi:GrpB family protein [Paenibacillus sp. UMB4589-SE434]|uniref:GrpB family protein n=1 Tax=Paenibacillus sp. UMB4589-SE434 TaxID=3046314 RepID=UPI00254FE171|nr:GrpB family protein [Paenibacillus sp. UMB4589-SE434]MDK8180530.1 GrpB family protein [Paenibacillus sp. UMB4589-SE434]